MILKLILLNKLNGEEIVFFDPSVPRFYDECDRDIIDFESNPFTRRRTLMDNREETGDKTRTFLNSFILRPQNSISMWWIHEQETFDEYFPHFSEAVFILTGRVITHMSAINSFN